MQIITKIINTIKDVH